MCQGKSSHWGRSVKIGALKNFTKFTRKIQKSVWSNVFWYVKVCYMLKMYSIHYKKISFGQNKRYKNTLFLLSRAPTHYSFIFDLRFLFELKQKVRLSKTTCWIFHFRSCFVSIKVYIFVRQNAWAFWI